MATPSGRRQRRRSAETESNEQQAEFTACVNLYSSLTWRFTRSAPFLYRTLRRDIPRTKSVEPQVLPTIRYVAADDGVTWSRKVSKMRCLWCARRFYRFTNEKELMLHLQTCHGRFKYEIEKKRPPAPKSPPENIVYMKLRNNQERLLSTSADSLSEVGEDDIYINPAKYGYKRMGPSNSKSTKRPLLSNDDPPAPKRQRPSRACVTAIPKPEDVRASPEVNGSDIVQKGEDMKKSSNSSGSSRQRSSRAKPNKARNTLVKIEKGTPAYKSMTHAVKEKRLWHSILQHPVSLQEAQAEDDSDNEREEEYEWRLQLANDEVGEFEDTLPVEKLLMNLWNQFLVMEFHTFADHRVAPACTLFAKKYRRIIHKYNLQITFLRHLTELARIGLLDSDAIYAIGMILKNRDSDPTEEEKGARFLFVERIMRQVEDEAGKSRA